VLGYDVDPQGGRLVVNPAEAERVREIFAINAGCASLAAVQQEVHARGLLTKDWTSKSGKHHRGCRFTQSRLDALLRNVLYLGQVRHKGVVYPGEQAAIVDRALWERAQQHLKGDTRARVPHTKVEALLSGILYCAQCGGRMRNTYSSRQGRRHLYYMCGKGKADAKCQQQPVAAVDLETSVIQQLEQNFRCHFDRTFLQHSVERISYDSRIHEVGVTLADASQFAYTLPVAKRPGVRRTFDEQQALGRVPRVSRLMALAVRFNELLSQGAARNHAELAQLGHVSRARMCQILMLTNLAPTIQEALLFLPKTVRGRDRITERSLRGIAKLVDWDAQIQLFRSRLAGSQQ
jgi:hypothetical protein